MPTKRSTWSTGPIFNVVIIYEDSAAGKRAKHFYDSVIRELVDECDFSLELWNFQALAFPDIGNSAAEAAARADIVIFSMHRKARLSVQTRDWIERWSGLISDNRSALVVMLDQPSCSEVSAPIAYYETEPGTAIPIVQIAKLWSDHSKRASLCIV